MLIRVRNVFIDLAKMTHATYTPGLSGLPTLKIHLLSPFACSIMLRGPEAREVMVLLDGQAEAHFTGETVEVAG